MNTSANLVVERIVNDRVQFLFTLLKTHPIHEIPDIYEKEYDISIATCDLEKIYQAWRSVKTYSFSHQLETVKKKADCWSQVIGRIKKQTISDVADFIYMHWKEHQIKEKK